MKNHGFFVKNTILCLLLLFYSPILQSRAAFNPSKQFSIPNWLRGFYSYFAGMYSRQIGGMSASGIPRVFNPAAEPVYIGGVHCGKAGGIKVSNNQRSSIVGDPTHFLFFKGRNYD